MPPKKKQTPSNQMINFYEKMPKKFLLKPDNPNYDLHQINNPFTMREERNPLGLDRSPGIFDAECDLT